MSHVVLYRRHLPKFTPKMISQEREQSHGKESFNRSGLLTHGLKSSGQKNRGFRLWIFWGRWTSHRWRGAMGTEVDTSMVTVSTTLPHLPSTGILGFQSLMSKTKRYIDIIAGFLVLTHLGPYVSFVHFDLDFWSYSLLGTNISHPKALLKMIFLFPRWDMWISWRVYL